MDNLKNNLEIITRQYYDEIFAYCRRHLKNEDDAYDITQTVFMALCGQYTSIKPDSVRKWLYSVAKNNVSDFYRDKQKYNDHFADTEISDDKIGRYDDPFDSISDSEIESIKSDVITKLNESERELYCDVYEKNTDYNTLAKKYSIPESTLRKRVSRMKIRIIGIIRALLYMVTFIHKLF